MSLAVLRAMLLSLVRDRSALAMVFVLPPLIFIVFATAFASSSGSNLQVRLAIRDAAGTPASAALARSVENGLALRGEPLRAATDEEVRTLVKRGSADIGVLVRSDPEAAPVRGAPAAIVIYVDPGKAIATPLVLATLERAMRARDAAPQAGAPIPRLAVEIAGSGTGRSITAAYYAGGVAILFLLFSGAQSAATLIDEQVSGTLDRVLAGPGGARHVVFGKFLFLLMQGVVQAGLIFAMAWQVYGVDLLARPLPWFVTTLASSAVCGALALALASFCRTRQQLQASSTFLILLMSAVGGSMAPRFTMPPWLQDLGWFTPNAWVIEAYQDTLWRGEPVGSLAGVWLGLLGLSVAALGVATLGVRRLSGHG